MMERDWMPVPGFPGYEAHPSGKVRSLDRLDARGHRRKGQVLKGTVTPEGRIRVNLSRDGRSYPFLVHQIILRTFVGPPEPGQVCRHLHGNPRDNRLESLRWGTELENAFDMIVLAEHHNIAKTHCPRRHLLEEPNLVPSLWKKGHRSCLACSRAKAYLRYYPDRMSEFEAEADRRYAEIMEVTRGTATL